MKKIFLIVFACAAVTAVGVVACNQSSTPSVKLEGLSELPQAISQDSLVHRGEYLVSIMGCHDCHSPKVMGPMGPEPDTSRLLSGHPAGQPIGPIDQQVLKDWVLFNHTTTAMAGPWGVSFAANLTSDGTGIGNWTEAQFFKAIREGRFKGLDNSRPLLPPMPWPMIAKASDDDLRAIFTYLKSTKPVANVVPAPIAPGK